MITKEQCADYINANIESVLTADEIATLKSSVKDHPARDILVASLIEVFGDVGFLIEIRDNV